jgi:DNA-binding GntR family transcriptional regulator
VNTLSAAVAAGQPQYALVAQRLIADISGGRYPVGGLLPTELELCRQFGVSRHTVREAIRRLQERGLVTRRRGIGTSVKAKRVQQRYVQSSMAISDLPRYVEETRLVTAAAADVIAGAALADLLRCPAGQRWIRVTGLRYAGKEKLPMALSDIYINAAYGGIRRRIGTIKVPVYTLIEKQYGISVVAVQQEIRASLIGAADARRLSVKPGSAGLVVTRRYFDPADRTIEVAVNLHPADRFSYSMSMRLQAAAGADA